MKPYILLLTLSLGFAACSDNNEPSDPAPEADVTPDNTSSASDESADDTSQPDTPADEIEDTAADQGAPVTATFRLINPTTGGGYSGVTLTGPEGTVTTDAQGTGSVEVPSAELYKVDMDAEGARRHTIFGQSGTDDFEQVTYLSPDQVTGFVYSQIGITDDPAKGIVVVGLDLPDLRPAVGASASLSADFETSFVLQGQSVLETETIPANALGFVSFANVEPGEVTVSAEYPNGACKVFPAEPSEEATITVKPGEVSIVALTCR